MQVNDSISFLTGAAIVHVPLQSQASINMIQYIETISGTDLMVGIVLFSAKTVIGGLLSIFITHQVNKFRKPKNKSENE